MTYFLDEIPLFTARQWPEKERNISNWMKVSKLIYTTEDMDEILRYLQLELLTRRRPMIVNRLYLRFSALRNVNEYEGYMSLFQLTLAPPKNPLYEDLLISWDHVYAQISAMAQTDLLALCHYEYWNKRRPYLMRRLITKHQTIRRTLEKKGIWTWSQKKRLSSTSENESLPWEERPTNLSVLSDDSY